MDNTKVKAFQETVQTYYHDHGRHNLPWRQPEPNGTFDPYKIVVSEMMLQQTQVPRVIPKFHVFLERFPSFQALAAASLGDVLRAWSGLGYNRRAQYLWRCAQQVVTANNGKLPHTLAELIKLPGIGPNTAGAILAYAYNKPALFVETNIRTVFIHHFFAGQQKVGDREILDLVARTLPDHPREWYWALMDYGVHLKQTVGNLSKASAGYTKQSRFEGSNRQIRGQILQILAEHSQTFTQLQTNIADARLADVLATLAAEGLIVKTKQFYKLQD